MLKNEKGLGILEVIVAASILLVTVLGLLTVMVNNNKAASVVGARSASTTLTEAMRTQLSSKTTCKNSFVVPPSSWSSPSEVKISLGDSVVGLGEKPLENYEDVLVESLSIGNFISFGSNPDTGVNYLSADLRIKTSSKKLSDRTSADGREDRFGMSTKTVAKVIFETDASGAFLNCYSLNPESDAKNITKSICELMGGQYIYNDQTQSGNCINLGKGICEGMGGTFSTASQKCDIARGGKPCVNSGQSSMASCSESLGQPKKVSEIAANERSEYIWYCTDAGGNRTRVPPGQVGTLDLLIANGRTCQAESKTVPTNSKMLNSGTSCFEAGSTSGSGTTTLGGRVSCLDGVMVSEPQDKTTTGGGSCFVATSKILMADGSYKDIASVRSGDLVRGLNSVNKVVGLENVILGNRRLVSINGSDYFASEEHPFASTQGWVAINPGLEKQNDLLGVMFMGLGQTLLKTNNSERIETLNLKYSHYDTPLFNLLLDGDHTYYVNDYLVHNKDATGGDGDGGDQ